MTNSPDVTSNPPPKKRILGGMRRYLLHGLAAFGLVVLAVTVANVGIYAATAPFIFSDVASAPVAQAALIPGAAILIDGGLSPVFRDRADLAIKLYEAKKVSKILVSGDNSTLSHNEVNPVRTYLLRKGIPDQDIFLDHAGFDTYSSMYRAQAVFGVESVLITTQSFHLPRAVFIARKLGVNAYGVDADVGHILPRNYVREVFANEKAVFELLTRREPKYLGEPIPITGDGRLYP